MYLKKISIKYIHALKLNLSIKQIKKFRIIKILNSLIIKNTRILIIKNLTLSEASLIKNTLLNILCYLI